MPNNHFPSLAILALSMSSALNITGCGVSDPILTPEFKVLNTPLIELSAWVIPINAAAEIPCTIKFVAPA